MGVVFNEVVGFMLSGRGLFTLIALVGSGFFIGGSFRFIGILLSSAIALFVGLGLYATSSYFRALDRIYQTGAAGFDVGVISIWIMGVLVISYGLAVWFGFASRKEAERQNKAAAASMTADEFLSIINSAAAHPVLGQGGWLVTRWGVMDAGERQAWVNDRLTKLRRLEALTEGAGIEALGVELPSALAELDQ